MSRLIPELMTDAEWAEANLFAVALTNALNEYPFGETFEIEFQGHDVRVHISEIDEERPICEIWSGRFATAVKVKDDGRSFYAWVEDNRPYDPRRIAAAERFKASDLYI